jgi:hypothetical protein
LVIDDRGDWVTLVVTLGHVDDRNGLKKMAKYIKGKLFGNPGSILKVLQLQQEW